MAASGPFVQMTLSGVCEAEQTLCGMRVAVWCRADQSDLVWYELVRISEGAYTALVDMASHQHSHGRYFAHVYSVHNAVQTRFEGEFRFYLLERGYAGPEGRALEPTYLVENGLYAQNHSLLAMTFATVLSERFDQVVKGARPLRGMVRRYRDRAQLKREGYQPWPEPSVGHFRVMRSDVLFVDGMGTTAPHPARYRVHHPMEQVAGAGFLAETVYSCDVEVADANQADVFVLYRAPLLERVERFIDEVHRQGKRIYFDVDDLVVDTELTAGSELRERLSPAQWESFQDSVRLMGAALQKCDGAICTTRCLESELGKFVQPVFVNRNVASGEMVDCSVRALEEKAHEGNQVVIGYFSGSSTHDGDFRTILEPLRAVLEENPHVVLGVVGDLDLPPELAQFEDRVERNPLVDWRELPAVIATADINLAPVRPTLFNEAKSENKWMEAALVKVPTIATNLGAFADAIVEGETGLLCSTEKEWYDKLTLLVQDGQLRERLAENAYDCVMRRYVAETSGGPLVEFLGLR